MKHACRPSPLPGLLVLAAALLTSPGVFAMNLNLAMPWGAGSSPPSKAELAFYSAQSATLLFHDEAEIVLTCRCSQRAVSMGWTLARNGFIKPFRTGAAQAEPAHTFTVRLATEGLYPGFYDLRVSCDAGEAKPLEGICTFGWRVDEMALTDDRPADFAEFWRRGLEELKALPLDAQEGPPTVLRGKEIDQYNREHACLPGDYDPTGHRTEEIEYRKVSFAAPGGLRLHGWLAKPPGPGPFPAVLVLPGAGLNARPVPAEHARHGYVALDLQIHGQDVDLPQYPPLPGYYADFVYTPPEAYYYHHVYLGCVQAVSYLLSRADVDPRRVAVVGGSQGGRLSVTTAALDPRVAAAVPAIAHNANLPYRKWSEACNRGGKPRDGMDRAAPAPLLDNAENRCLAYYDVVNFAPQVRCPVLMNAGLVDPVSPPYGCFAVFSRLGSADKAIVPLPGLGHDWSAEFDRRAWRWLDQVLSR